MEFAIVAPVLLTVVLGVAQASCLYETQNILANAIREGARLASMDRSGIVPQGMSTNDKIIQDIQNFLTANGFAGDEVTVSITDPDNDLIPFDLDDPDNDLELFKVTIELPYGAMNNYIQLPNADEIYLSADLTFRNNRASLVQ